MQHQRKGDQSQYYRLLKSKELEVSTHILTNFVLDDLLLNLKDIENTLDTGFMHHKVKEAMKGIQTTNAKHIVLSSKLVIAKTSSY